MNEWIAVNRMDRGWEKGKERRSDHERMKTKNE